MDRNILAWLGHLQASVRAGSGDISAANFASSASASLSGAKQNPNSEGDEEEEDGGDASVLADASVPLGLITNLSLSNNRSRKRRRPRGESATWEEELDDLNDDNVVHALLAGHESPAYPDADNRQTLEIKNNNRIPTSHLPASPSVGIWKISGNQARWASQDQCLSVREQQWRRIMSQALKEAPTGVRAVGFASWDVDDYGRPFEGDEARFEEVGEQGNA
ncbi:hypothetical protein B0H14DRAFT_3436994 [Mycena olivaceomarginata]|nr:hypothetical protein B0H14DRAFT_3436994 [Mycena olivaceomarginata]